MLKVVRFKSLFLASVLMFVFVSSAYCLNVFSNQEVSKVANANIGSTKKFDGGFKYVLADDISFVDDIKINGREFESLDEQVIEFYEDDLQDGKVVVDGILESNDENVPVESLFVQISIDGGDSWQIANGHENWSWSFEPEIGQEYEFALRVVRLVDIAKNAPQIVINSPSQSMQISTATTPINFNWDFSQNATYKLVIKNSNQDETKIFQTNNKNFSTTLNEIALQSNDKLLWHVEAYDLNGNLLSSSKQRELLYPPFLASLNLTYHTDKDISTQIDNGKTINVNGTVSSIKLDGSIKNTTDSSTMVDVVLKSNNNILMTKSILANSKSTTPFALNIASKLAKGENHLSVEIKKTQINAVDNGVFYASSFTISKSDKTKYKIGDFTLLSDVVAVNGKISGSGVIKVPVLSKFDGCDGNLEVSFSNLHVDSQKNITSGEIQYTTRLSYKPISKIEIISQKIVFTTSDAYMQGKVSIKKIGKFVAPLNVDIPHMSLQADNFKFDTDYDWQTPQKVPLYDGVFALSLSFKHMHLKIDSSKSLAKIVQVTDLQGGIDFGQTFKQTNTTITLNTDGSINWKLNGYVGIDGSDVLYFKNCSGVIDIVDSNPSMSVKGKLIAYFEKGTDPNRKHLEVDLGDSLVLNSHGLQGDVGFNTETIPQGKPAILSDIPMTVKSFHVLFDGYVSGGGMTITINYDNFLKTGKKLDLLIAADISLDGISNFRLQSSNASIDIKKFATISLHDFAVEQSDSGFSFVTDMDVHVKSNDVIHSDTDISLEKLYLDKDGIKLTGAAIWQSLGDGSSTSASLYGVDIHMSKIGIGLKNKRLYIGVEGGGGIAGDVISIDNMKVALYATDVELLNTPSVHVDNSAVTFEAGLKKVDNDSIKGFSASGMLSFKTLGNGLQINAEFMSGSFINQQTHSSNGSYWRVAASASTSTPIPLSPIPLNLYGFGGGIGYNVAYDITKRKWTPKKGSGIVISATTIFGTTDGGYSVNGPATFSFSTGGQITFNSKMYFRASLGSKPQDRYLDVVAQLSTSPFAFYASGIAHITEKGSGDFKLIQIDGDIDMVFSSSQKHLYIGTKEEPVQAKFLELARNESYLMLDSKGLAFGYKMQLEKSGSCCFMYGSINVGTSLDMMIGMRPLYIDAQGQIWAIVSAGVKYHSFSYEVFSGGANIAARFRAPNPTWGKFDVSMYYSILGGAVSGKYNMTYWINKPNDTEESTSITANNIKLIQYIIPSDGDMQISRMPKIEIATTLPIGQSVLVDDLIDEPTGQSYKLFIRKAVEVGGNTSRYTKAANATQYIRFADINDTYSYARSLTGGVVGSNGNKIFLYTDRLLPANHTFRVTMEAYLQNVNTGEIINTDTRMVHFTTSKDDSVNFSSIIEDVHPRPNAKHVYKQSDLYVKVRGMYDPDIQINLYDPLGRKVNEHPWKFNSISEDNSQASQMYAYVYSNHPDLNDIIVYECDQTHEQREAIYDENGNEKNPFWHISTSQTTSSSATPAHSWNQASVVSAVNANSQHKTRSNYSYSQQNYQRQISTSDAVTNHNNVHYTYTRRVLTTYTIKAQKNIDGVLTDIFSSTFDVYGRHIMNVTDKSGSVHTQKISYDNDIDMLHQTLRDAKFIIHRGPINYEQKEREWQDYLSNTYDPAIRYCDSLTDEYGDEEDDMAAWQCTQRANKKKEKFLATLNKRYAHGPLESLSLYFAHTGALDPSNISMSITPTCNITTDSGISYNINPQEHAFANVVNGAYSGSDEYQIISNNSTSTTIMLNLSKAGDMFSRLSSAIEDIDNINSKNIKCGYFSIFPRYLTNENNFDASVSTHSQTKNGHGSVYKNNILLREE